MRGELEQSSPDRYNPSQPSTLSAGRGPKGLISRPFHFQTVSSFAACPVCRGATPGTEDASVNRKVWLGVAVSALLLWLSLRDVDLRQAWIYTQSVNGAYVVPSVALVIVEALLRALKWQILLLPLKRSSFLKLNSATMIGLMANNVLPARAGEFVRAYAGARLAEIPYSTSLATVVIDRVLDG